MRVTKESLFVGSIFLFGPMGKALLPGFPLDSVRFFYLLLPFSIIYIQTKENSRSINILLLAYIAICANSILLGQSKLPSEMQLQQHPLIRLFIHSMIVCFFMLAAWRAVRLGNEYVFKMINLTFLGFIWVTVIGFILWGGFVMGALPLKLVSLFNVMSQIGYGFLRFSPGSYPNEYGTTAAFFSASAFYLLSKKDKRVPRKRLIYVAALGFLGLALATTRSAYITYIISLFIVFLAINTRGKVYAGFVSCAFLTALFFSLPSAVIDNAQRIIEVGYSSAVNGTGSISMRYSAWAEAAEIFKGTELFGIGFENPDVAMIHNTFLQFLFGLGVLGFFAIVFLFGLVCVLFRARFALFSGGKGSDKALSHIAIIGGVNVCFFALNNHNQNHFLTWFVIFVLLASGCFASPKTTVKP